MARTPPGGATTYFGEKPSLKGGGAGVDPGFEIGGARNACENFFSATPTFKSTKPGLHLGIVTHNYDYHHNWHQQA